MAKLKINRGTTYQLTLEYNKDKAPSSLVGATVRFTVKTSEFDASTDDSTALVTKNITDGTAEGIAVITLDPQDTATLEPKTYYYDIKVDQNSDGTEVYKVDEGTIVLDGSPTNRLT